MRDPGLAEERTALARRRTTIPFLVVALLWARAALDVPVAGLLVAGLAAVGALASVRRSPSVLVVVVVLLAGAGVWLAVSVPVPGKWGCLRQGSLTHLWRTISAAA